jgi:hypothetical protein
VQPVTDVVALAVEGNMLVVDEVGNEEGDDLFRKVERAIVVGAAGDREVETVCAMVAARQEVTACLRSRVGGVGFEGSILGPRSLRD